MTKKEAKKLLLRLEAEMHFERCIKKEICPECKNRLEQKKGKVGKTKEHGNPRNAFWFLETTFYDIVERFLQCPTCSKRFCIKRGREETGFKRE